jgi:tryptophanyl-tRNA synthetase
MSKSSPDPSTRIQLTDTFPEISRKIRSAVTDSIQGITYDPVNRRGTSNLLSILSACIDEPVETIVKRYEGKGHGDLKKEVSEALRGIIERSESRISQVARRDGLSCCNCERRCRESKRRYLAERCIKSEYWLDYIKSFSILPSEIPGRTFIKKLRK